MALVLLGLSLDAIQGNHLWAVNCPVPGRTLSSLWVSVPLQFLERGFLQEREGSSGSWKWRDTHSPLAPGGDRGGWQVLDI